MTIIVLRAFLYFLNLIFIKPGTYEIEEFTDDNFNFLNSKQSNK